MRRAFLVLLLCCWAGSGAVAQTAQVDRIDVTEYGLYTADISGSQGIGSAGIQNNLVTNVQHAATTRTVPAQLGVHFGFRYTIVGSPDGAPVQLTKVTIFPSGGLHKPDAAGAIDRDSYTLARQVGQASFTDYSLDNSWELVPGRWTFELWANGKLLVSQSFDVVRAGP